MVRHAHSSSLYSNPPSSLSKELDKLVSADDPEANLATYTEVGSSERTACLKKADEENWAAWVPDQSDVGIMWRKDDFGPKEKKAVKLTDKVWTDGHGRKHETWCATALLEHRNNGNLLFLSVCHLPSHVQNGNKFYDNAQAKAWKGAVSGWSDHWNDWRKKYKPDLAILSADWNVDFHSSTWRDKVQSYFPSLFLSWQGNMPPKGKGTHGSRLIDASMNTVKANVCKLLPDDNSSDHRPWGQKVPF